MKCLVCSKLFREGFRQGEEFRDELLLESKKTKRENNAIFYPKVQYKTKSKKVAGANAVRGPHGCTVKVTV